MKVDNLKLFSFSASVVFSLFAGYFICRALMKKYKRPKRKVLKDLDLCNWENVGFVENLWIYPIKSCAGIDIKEATVEKNGIRKDKFLDRSFLIIDKKGELITARKCYQTLFIRVEFNSDDDTIILTAKNAPTLNFSLKKVVENANEIWLTIFGEKVSGLDCGKEVSDWLLTVVNRECRLLYSDDSPHRRSTASFTSRFPLMDDDDYPIYGDTGSIMLMTTGSLADLRLRTNRNLPAQNFRPNILVRGSTQPYEEDDWTYLKIGNCIFRNGMPCQRCVFTTIDYKTGERDPQMEPLKTLKKYRCSPGEKSPNFGIYLGVDRCSSIAQGDTVYALRN